MRPLEVGLVLPMLEAPPTGEKPTWAEIRSLAVTAEQTGINTLWIPDELLWRSPSWPGPRGWWECVAMTAAVAASTSTIGVGTWVLSALHRNPGLTAKIVETLDEVSDGRFILGLGAGHAGGQGEAFGYPLDKTIGRFVEALQIILPLLAGEAVDFEGEFHRAKNLEQRPKGPRPGSIPLMIGGHGPRTMRIVARHADIWSAYATESSLPESFTEMLHGLDTACEEEGRDPSTLGRSIGVFVQPGDGSVAEDAGFGVPITGSPSEIAATIATFAEMGCTRLELILLPPTMASLEALAPVLGILDG